MKKIFSLLLCLAGTILLAGAQSKTIQERLGYPKDTKLLIIHADDLGVSHSENEASINAMEKGSVNSASIMVPTPWFSEIAAYAASHPKADLGLHLTLTSEWKYYKWGATAKDVPGLENNQGFMFSAVDSVYRSATLQEIEKELRMQIVKAKRAAVDFTHFDSHMGTLFGREDYLKTMMRLGREYKVPVMLIKTAAGTVFNYKLDSFITNEDVFADAIYTASPADFKTGMSGYYAKVLTEMKAGLNILIIHTAYDDKEMQAVTVDHPDWGAAWRQADYDFFTSDACKKNSKEQKIQLITWREIRDKLLR